MKLLFSLSCLWESGGPSDADRMETKSQEDKGFACHFHCLIPSPDTQPTVSILCSEEMREQIPPGLSIWPKQRIPQPLFLRMFPPPVLTRISASSLLSAACLLLSDPLPILRRHMAPLDSPVHKAGACFLSVFCGTLGKTSLHSLTDSQTPEELPPDPCSLALHILQLWGPLQWCSRGPALRLTSTGPLSPSLFAPFCSARCVSRETPRHLEPLPPARLSALDSSYRIPCKPVTNAVWDHF